MTEKIYRAKDTVKIGGVKYRRGQVVPKRRNSDTLVRMGLLIVEIVQSEKQPESKPKARRQKETKRAHGRRSKLSEKVDSGPEPDDTHKPPTEGLREPGEDDQHSSESPEEHLEIIDLPVREIGDRVQQIKNADILRRLLAAEIEGSDRAGAKRIIADRIAEVDDGSSGDQGN